jgi:acyl-CoA synthetase (AMP-forming)/AMP-acid ligase II
LYILDAQLQPVPVGIEGELYIGGAGLSQGYLNQPVLTTEKFIDLNSERLYKTGDRACYLSDGRIEYLGRRDQQVKIRGYRIELEEIAARLQQHPDIGEAIVTTVTDHHQNTRLVAYITTNNPKENLNTVTLKQFHKTKLPDYMLPSLFIPIDSIPLTTNGKVDRQQLPPPNWTNQPAPELAAQTLIESNLCQIWSDLLGVPVGIHDNFFDLGGDSILSLQIIARGFHPDNSSNIKLSLN